MRRIFVLFCFMLLTPLSVYSAEKHTNSSAFHVWADLKQMEPLKVAWDFNFANPEEAYRALNPITYAIKANAEHGPVSFDPMLHVVVSHGGEAVIWAKKNYSHFKDVVDQARRLHEQFGVRFEVCSIVAQAHGFDETDYHDFVHVVPTGSYALVYWANKGYAVIPAGSTTPSRAVNEFNEKYLGKARNNSGTEAKH